MNSTGRYRPTPGHVLLGLLVVEGLLLLSERFRWFAFNRAPGWTALISVATLLLAILFLFVWFLLSLLFRWRFQYSIRSLLLLVVVVAIPCSRFAARMRYAEARKETADAIQKVGWSVGYAYEYDESGNAKWDAKPKGPEWLQKLLGREFFAVVGFVAFGDQGITDDCVEHLKGLPQLQGLYLNSTLVTDAGLEHLKGLTELQCLYLIGTKVTDEGVKKLQQALPNCKIYH